MMINYEHGSALDLANHYVNLSDVGIELLHKVFGDEVSPPLLIGGILKNGTEDIVEDQI